MGRCKSVFTSVVKVGVAACCALIMGCATNIKQPTITPMSAKVKLGTFERIEVLAVTAVPGVPEGNAKAIGKIDENLRTEMTKAFPDVKFVSSEDAFSKGGNVLQVIPVVKDIKFIGGAARFWVGAMAGSSAVLVYVKCVNAATGEIVAEGDFYEVAGAHSGSWSIGASDNMMLVQVAKNIVQYFVYNK